MSINVESMFYVKQNPWHGLGTKVEQAVNSKEALELAGLNWNVDQKRVFVDGVSIPKYKANVRSSDGKVLGIVSDKYKIVQNTEAFEFTDNLIGNGDIEIKYETAGSLVSGKRIWLLAQMPTTTILGDDVEPYMVFTNTHDGTGAIKVAMTPIRVVCQNTLTLALQKASRTWTTRHMGDMESKMHEAEVTLGLAKAYMSEINEMAETLEQIKITDENLKDFMNIAFPIPFGSTATDRRIKNTESMRETFNLMYKNIADVKKFNNTGWMLYNVVSDFVSHVNSLRQTNSLAENKFMKLVDGDKTLESTQKFILGL